MAAKAALTKVSSLRGVGNLLIPKKARDEISNVAFDITSTVEEQAKWVLNKLKLKGKAQRELPDLLTDYNLPPGIFPDNIICYEHDESTGKLVIHMSSPCEVCFKDGTVLRYATRVKATLSSKGKLLAIDGVKTKILVWVKVSAVYVESFRSDKVWFTATGVKKCKAKDVFDLPRQAIKVEQF